MTRTPTKNPAPRMVTNYDKPKPAKKHAKMKVPPVLSPVHGHILWSFGQKKVISAHLSDARLGSDFLCHGSVPVTMYDNRTTHPDAAKLEAVRKYCEDTRMQFQNYQSAHGQSWHMMACEILKLLTPSRAGRRKG